MLWPTGHWCTMSNRILTRWVYRLLGLALVSLATASVSVHRLSLRLSCLGVFHSLFFICHWISIVFLMYLHPFDRPFTHSLVRWDSRLGTISGTRWYGSTRGGAGMRMKQKSRVKFLPWQYCVQCSTIWINLRKWHVHVHVYTWNLAKYIWDWEIEAKIWLRLGLRLVPRTPKSLKRICWQPTCYIVCLAKQSKCDAFLIMSCGVLFMMFTATL